MKSNKIKISSSKGNDFFASFQLDGKTYEVITEDLGVKKAKIMTRIYLKGEILSTTVTDYAHPDELPDDPGKLKAIMEEQQKSAIDKFIKENSRPPKLKSDYAEAIKLDLRAGNNKAALDSVREALLNFPMDPFFLSYFGYLTAIVEKKSRDGARNCEEAISILKKSNSSDIVFFLPLFYLHLGRVHLKANRKVLAINAFEEGLKFDSNNRELLAEMKAFGTRKGPVLPFLERNNPINMYLGKLRYKLKSKS